MGFNSGFKGLKSSVGRFFESTIQLRHQ